MDFQLDESKVPAGAIVIVVNPGTALGLVKILFEKELIEIGTAKVTKIDKKATGEAKPFDVITVHATSKFLVIMP